ncbi:hypothetical protein [Methylobacterium frigidaeris]|uniref:Uncharacterized protein n=1 Tax=Methylobacterium frigidaeris TaxID=2038277 RepID=A0AA37HC07_9HYPH|nr:hypothetical protein [Methylobacterium frigidaeris]PIK74759.1 hypothetical protein CS379_00745 [Methylobacterium frigidaeris]GJD63059.1 hypothetical protein MPEAHAMD_3220 [Methylobacterium frigidaeris]
MSSELTQSGTPDGAPEVAAADEAGAGTGSIAVGEDGASVSIAQAETVSDTAPPSMFRPTMRDVDASASETGMTVKPRPMMPDESGDATAPFTDPDAAADQALILGPSDQGETDDTTTPTAEAEGGTPTVAPTEVLSDGTNLFGDRAAMWSGNPSEVGAAYGLDPTHDEVCLCDEVSLAVGEDV